MSQPSNLTKGPVSLGIVRSVSSATVAGRTCHSVGFVTMRLIIGVLMCVLVLSTDVLSFAWHSKIGFLLGLFHFFFLFCIFNFVTCIWIATLVLDSENKIQTTISFYSIPYTSWFTHIHGTYHWCHTTKHLLCITELILRYLHQLW